MVGMTFFIRALIVNAFSVALSVEAFTSTIMPAVQFQLPSSASSLSVLTSSTARARLKRNGKIITSDTVLKSTLLSHSTFSSVSSNENGSQIPLPNHSGKVAVVIGSSRGIGKGIAIECALSGMTVYVVGRSSRSNKNAYKSMLKRDLGEEWNDDSTIERTCDDIRDFIAKQNTMTHPGGEAIPVSCDVADQSQVISLIEKVKSEQGRCDLLVYSAFPTPPNLSNAKFRDEFWKQNVEMWDPLCEVGLRSAYMTCCEAIPLMIDTAKLSGGNSETRSYNQPMIVLVSSFGGRSYAFNVAYGVQKAALDRLASDMSVQLKQYNVDTVSLYPGVVRTEGNIQALKAGTWDEATGGMDLENNGESVRFSGRAVVHLMDRSNGSLEWIGGSGKVGVVAELAKYVGFVDEDGRRPPSIRSLRYLLSSFVFPKIEKEMNGGKIPDFIRNNIPDYLLPWDIFMSGPPPED
ncbi:hypothetical protein ACHAXS_011538 [Conticribra weissflogii]